jgi:hypothetical protein
MPITVKVTSRLEITQALLPTSTNVNIIDNDVAAASLSTQNVVVLGLFRRSTSNILNLDILDDDAVRGVSSWSTIEIVLLDIDAVVGDVLDTNVFEDNVGDEASGA